MTFNQSASDAVGIIGLGNAGLPLATVRALPGCCARPLRGRLT